MDGVKNLFVNASAIMIGYGNRLLPAGVQEKKYPGSGHIHVDDEQELLMIHDVSSGELIRQLNLSDEFQSCRRPYPVSIALPNSQTGSLQSFYASARRITASQSRLLLPGFRNREVSGVLIHRLWIQQQASVDSHNASVDQGPCDWYGEKGIRSSTRGGRIRWHHRMAGEVARVVAATKLRHDAYGRVPRAEAPPHLGSYFDGLSEFHRQEQNYGRNAVSAEGPR